MSREKNANVCLGFNSKFLSLCRKEFIVQHFNVVKVLFKRTKVYIFDYRSYILFLPNIERLYLLEQEPSDEKIYSKRPHNRVNKYSQYKGLNYL